MGHRSWFTITLLTALMAFGVTMLIIVQQSGASANDAKPSTSPTPAERMAKVFTQIEANNAAIDRCMAENGATRVPYGDQGWSYDDPEGRASTACQSLVEAGERYAHGPEARSAALGLTPDSRAFVACMVPTWQRLAHEALGEADISAAETKCGGQPSLPPTE